LSTLCARYIRSSIFGLVVPIGSPRYVKGKLSVLHPKTLASTWHLSDEILIGAIEVLW
jgi:hypothetical protein